MSHARKNPLFRRLLGVALLSSLTVTAASTVVATPVAQHAPQHLVVDSINKKKGKGHYASAKKVELTGLGAAPTRGGATASLSLRF